MILLDEQIRADQRLLLARSRIRFRQIGKDMAAAGIKDENIIPFLLTLKRPTLFTHDHGFFQSSLAHSRYCLVLLAESDIEAAFYIRRFLRHSRFNTTRKRMGTHRSCPLRSYPFFATRLSEYATGRLVTEPITAQELFQSPAWATDRPSRIFRTRHTSFS